MPIERTSRQARSSVSSFSSNPRLKTRRALRRRASRCHSSYLLLISKIRWRQGHFGDPKDSLYGQPMDTGLLRAGKLVNVVSSGADGYNRRVYLLDVFGDAL